MVMSYVWNKVHVKNKFRFNHPKNVAVGGRGRGGGNESEMIDYNTVIWKIKSFDNSNGTVKIAKGYFFLFFLLDNICFIISIFAINTLLLIISIVLTLPTDVKEPQIVLHLPPSPHPLSAPVTQCVIWSTKYLPCGCLLKRGVGGFLGTVFFKFLYKKFYFTILSYKSWIVRRLNMFIFFWKFFVPYFERRNKRSYTIKDPWEWIDQSDRSLLKSKKKFFIGVLEWLCWWKVEREALKILSLLSCFSALKGPSRHPPPPLTRDIDDGKFLLWTKVNCSLTQAVNSWPG
jgi:hypothetical protein